MEKCYHPHVLCSPTAGSWNCLHALSWKAEVSFSCSGGIAADRRSHPGSSAESVFAKKCMF